MNSEQEVYGRSATLGLAAAIISVLTLVLPGCATAPPPVEETKLVWPAPPLPTRIRFVRSIVSEQDLNADNTFNQSLAAFLTGEKIPEGRIAEPMGMAVSDDGERLYVSDFMQHQVFIFDFTKKLFSKLEEVSSPAGIALDAEENLYVVDSAKRLISVFGRDGKIKNEITDPTIERPIGLAIDKVRRKIYLVDTGSRTSKEQNVKIYSLDGKRIGAIGGAPGGGEGEFQYPTFACVDSAGYLYVTDSLNGRVQKFDSNGKFQQFFGQPGSSWGEFDKPKGVAVDSFGNVYVADSGWSNVQIFNPQGQILLFFGGRGPIPGMMKNPISLAIDKQNRIYVGDYLNHRIGVYDLVNTAGGDSFINPPPNPTGRTTK
jgi:DNA-binding beta-propeller fold protein YncE